MARKLARRSFCRSVVATAASGWWLSRWPRRTLADSAFDPSFSTAAEALQAIRSRVISCRELLDHVFGRIKRYDSQIHAFITLNEEQARKQAEAADETLARGGQLRRLHGLPIVIKDAFETRGLRTTCGSKTLLNHVPDTDAVAVARLRAEGAVIVGKTNIPEYAGDVQSFNEIAGTCNNPWDLTRTPGGSTGGGAAALAAGFGFLELGSDFGGSIRTPAHFCGVYGHKPTLNVVPMDGHMLPPPADLRAVVDLAVTGPLARCAEDLRLALEVIGGPNAEDGVAYQWRLPAPRRLSLKEYRVGYVLDDPFCPVTPEVLEVISQAIDALRKAGVCLVEGWPKEVTPAEQWDTYYRLAAAASSPFETEETLAPLREMTDGPWAHAAGLWLTGNAMSHKSWLSETVHRLQARRAWQRYFRDFDVFVTPESFVPAFPHDHNKTFDERILNTSLGVRPYGDILKWIAIPTLTGCPATVAPVGRTKQGLPVGIQVMGPYMEDATPIDIAARIAHILGGFQSPPAFPA